VNVGCWSSNIQLDFIGRWGLNETFASNSDSVWGIRFMANSYLCEMFDMVCLHRSLQSNFTTKSTFMKWALEHILEVTIKKSSEGIFNRYILQREDFCHELFSNGRTAQKLRKISVISIRKKKLNSLTLHIREF